MKTKRILSLVLAVVLAGSLLAACGGGGGNATTAAPAETTAAPAETTAAPAETTAPAEETTTQEVLQEFDHKDLVVGITADPKYWDPWSDFNQGRRDTIPVIYQCLASYVPDLEGGEVIEYLVLAESYENTADDEWTVKIRENIVDTAGNKFDANDVKFCLDTAREKGIWAELNAVDDIIVKDDYTVVFKTNKNLKVGDFQNILTNFPMVTQESYEASADAMVSMPVGTTGYVMESYTAGESVVFKKADSYWNDAANESQDPAEGYCPWFDCRILDSITFKFITDDSAMSIALENGEIDITSNLSAANATVLQANPDFAVGTRPGNMYGISFNVSDTSPTKNINLRQAIAYAVDSAGVLQLAASGAGTILKAWAYPTYTDWQDAWDSADYFGYDLAKAQDYLKKYYEETGTTAADLHIRLLTQSSRSDSKIAEAVQGYIVALTGNENCVEIVGVERTVYESMWEADDTFDILLLYGQTDTRTTCCYTWSRQANQEKTMSGNDVWHSNDDEGQRLLQLAIDVDTHSDQTVADFQKYINDQVYIKNMFSIDTFIVGKSWISNIGHFSGYKDGLPVCTLRFDWANSGK
ncbi:MAG: ABC transporter substrate-binding protein [Lachnospiraceae bacterium]|nr:ABC transporter substrate-binding protein [Lachnospiraceae bacterium]